jgi:hypothetical protein
MERWLQFRHSTLVFITPPNTSNTRDALIFASSASFAYFSFPASFTNFPVSASCMPSIK